ncbi:MAG: ornithine cyclodeaminase family protein [Deltaproteobacteria bacterium]|nr:ornithine cyclodeaminase family protein [Deltaproteobacteria bacterium]
MVIFNPGFLKGGRGFGVKVVSDFYDNDRRGMERMTALLVLCDGQTGQPRAVLSAGALTDLRTGGVAGLAASLLARPDAAVLGVVGAGRVARHQIPAVCEVRPIEAVRIASRGAARAEALQADLARAWRGQGPQVSLVQHAEEAVREADVVITATTSQAPVVAGQWLKPGVTVIASGAHAPDARELDSEVIRTADLVVVDSREDCLEAAGDLLIPMREGLLRRERVSELGEIVLGLRPGRQAPEARIVFKNMGVPLQDLITGQELLRRAEAAGVGLLVDL